LRLENEGFALDTGRRVRLLRALNLEGARFLDPERFDELKYLIAPLVARSAREQEQFYQIFEAFRESCRHEWENWENVPPTPPPVVLPPPAKPWWKRHAWLLATLLTTAAAAWWIISRLQPETEPLILALQRMAEPGADTLFIDNQSTGIDSALFRWRVLDAETGTLEFADSTHYHLAWPIRDAGREKRFELSARHPRKGYMAHVLHLTVPCPDPPVAGEIVAPEGDMQAGRTYAFSLPGVETGCRVRWIFSNADTLDGPAARYAFERAGVHDVRAEVWRPGQEAYCLTRRFATVELDADKPYLALLPLHEDTPRPQYRLHTWVWLLSLLPLLPAAWLFRRWQRRRKAKLRVKTDAERESEYLVLDEKPWRIPYRPQEHKITVPRAFFRIAEVLHRRERSLRTSFDIPESVRATIEGAGFPVLRERAGAQPSAYLFLVERRDEYDQQGRLFVRLAEFLRRRETPAVFFEHDGAFDRFRNEEHPEGLDLAELRRRYPGHRLVLLGNAHALTRVPEGKAPTLRARPAADLRRWPRRLLLTPEPPAAWAWQEEALHAEFLLFPADTDGMLEGFELLDRTEEHEPGPFERWRATQRRSRADHNHRHNPWLTPRDHRLYLLDDPEAWRWLCALSVCSRPDWSLTLAVGRAVGVEVTHDRLLKLTRIPWLGANQPDFALRLALLRELDEADERAARQAVADELEAVREQTQGGFADLERRSGLALQYFALDPGDENQRQTLRDLRALGLLDGSQVAELDALVEQKIDPAELPPGASRTLDGLLAVPPPKPPLFTRDLLGALALLGLALLTAGLAWWMRTTPAPPLGSEPLYRQVPASDPAVDLNNEAVRLARKIVAQADWESWKNLSRASMPAADSLFAQALNLRRPEAYPLADSNRTALSFNTAAQGFNFFLDGAVPGIQVNRNAADTTANGTPTSRSFFQELTRAFERVAGDSATLAASADTRRLNALHALGLCAHYSGDSLGARAAYRRLLGAQPGYFDTLRVSMPVNLQTLLGVGLVRPVADFEVSSDSCCVPCTVQFVNNSQNTSYFVWNYGDGSPLNVDVEFSPTHIYTKPGTYTVSLIAASECCADTITRVLNICDSRKKPPAASDNREQADWASAKKEDSPAGYEAFLKNYPDSRYAAEARERIAAMRAAEREQAAWAVARKTATRAAYEEFLKNHPDSGYAPAVRERIAELRDDEAWAAAQKTGSPEACRQYLREYPKGRHAAEAQVCADKQDTAPPDPDTPRKRPGEDMVLVRGGTFTMGCLDEKRDGDCADNEKPPHQVTLRDFYIDRTEVTNAQYAAFLNEYGTDKARAGGYAGETLVEEHRWGVQKNSKTGRWEPAPGKAEHPVVHISWYGAAEYARFYGRRLPTEAEWEYAARGGNESKGYLYAGSNTLKEVGWYYDNSGNTTRQVKRLKANELGLHDMSGNVWEWVADIWHNNYEGAPTDGNAWGDSGDYRVGRGGSWGNGARGCRVANRGNNAPSDRGDILGFRLCRSR